ncbi:MAG: DUF2892 domain-containing protein [Candidatus Anstonellales archaeon]
MLKFEKNVGELDRFFRLAIGSAILFAGIMTSSWLGLLGIIPIITATTRFCPAYSLIGINTCKFDKKEDQKSSKNK